MKETEKVCLIPRIVEMLQAIHSPEGLGTCCHCVIHLTAEDEKEVDEAEFEYLHQNFGRPLAEQIEKEGFRRVFPGRFLGHDVKWDAERTMVEDLTAGFKAGDGWLKRPEKEPSDSLVRSLKYTGHETGKIRLQLNTLERRVKQLENEVDGVDPEAEEDER